MLKLKRGMLMFVMNVTIAKIIFKGRQTQRHIENFTGVPGVFYNFNTKKLISFQDNFYPKSNMPFVFYFDFETTVPTNNCFDPDQKKMFVVSYVLIVAFHPALNLNRIITQRSYAHSLNELATLNYLYEDQMKFIDSQILNQLKDIGIDVSKRKCKNTMGQVFYIETALLKKTLLAWFNKKTKLQNLEIQAFTKCNTKETTQYRVNWKSGKGVICKMPLKIEPTNFKMPDDEMTDGDFTIRFEHMFVRNIYIFDQIKESHHLETLEKYYGVFQFQLVFYLCLTITIKMTK